MTPLNAPLSDNIDILAVRGKLTIKELSLPADTLTGDPGILSARYFPKSPRKFRWGVVPHYSHRNSKEIKAAVKATKAKLIDATDPVEKVLSEISSCDAIISSSLHGLIVADSYGVPCAWLNKKSHGDHTFKFADYCSGVGRPDFEVVTVENLGDRLAEDPDLQPFSPSAELQDRLIQALQAAPLRSEPA
ncbi:MAG: polysaccharide pyruvyl transferase family protein [Paracoccaceae bacterium]